MNPVARIPGAAQAPRVHRFTSAVGQHLLSVADSRIYDIDAGPHAQDGGELEAMLQALSQTLALTQPGGVPLESVIAPSPQSISLNVSSSCNLSCSYCYAARGNFEGAQPQPMSWDVARAAIDGLLDRADPGAPITIGFMGGEPFVNRRLIHQSVNHAAAAGQQRGLDLRFSVTTNGTLLQEDDLQMLRSHRFAVTVSVDGDARTQERMRPLVNGKQGSHAMLSQAIAPLLSQPGKAQVAARVTVSRFNLDLMRAFDAIVQMGFQEAGFAPLKSGSPCSGPLGDDDWVRYLGALTALARRELGAAQEGRAVRLTNLAVALKQLHRGACSPYPCGAGGGYFSVGAKGDWYACHRAIGKDDFRLGDSAGLDDERRKTFLMRRHVHAQDACGTCWARYLCSGGCHQEAAERSVASCDFVRGWLEFCLAAYAELSECRPEYFGSATSVSPVLPEPITQE